jgi:cyclopropane fatty-acyl-phospholipid synthase-like methyltransferase
LFLEREGFEITGLDISRKTVGQLRERFPDSDFQAGYVRDTGMEDNTFDACFSWGVFEHFEDGPYEWLLTRGLSAVMAPLFLALGLPTCCWGWPASRNNHRIRK